MYVDRSEEGSGSQNLSKGERLRNVFIVFGVVAAIVLVSHILIKCRNRIPHIKNWSSAGRRRSIRPATPPDTANTRRQRQTPAFTRAELDAVAPKLILSQCVLYDPSAFEESSKNSTPVSTSPAVTRTPSIASIASLPQCSNDNAASPTKCAVRTTEGPHSDPTHALSTPASDTTCSICLDPLFSSSNDDVQQHDQTHQQTYIRIITLCNHAFHSHCLQTWLLQRRRRDTRRPDYRQYQQPQNQPRCPLCQLSLRTSNRTTVAGRDKK